METRNIDVINIQTKLPAILPDIYIYIYIYWHKCSIFKKVTAADSHRELSRIELLRSKKQIVGIGHWEGGVDHGDDRNDNKGHLKIFQSDNAMGSHLFPLHSSLAPAWSVAGILLVSPCLDFLTVPQSEHIFVTFKVFQKPSFLNFL